jgi:hypothetical protein
LFTEVPRCAQDFGSGLRRPLSASSSSPVPGTMRSFCSLVPNLIPLSFRTALVVRNLHFPHNCRFLGAEARSE